MRWLFPALFSRLLVFSREWASGGGIGGRFDNEEEEDEARKKYKAMCDGVWSLLPTLVSSPVSRLVTIRFDNFSRAIMHPHACSASPAQSRRRRAGFRATAACRFRRAAHNHFHSAAIPCCHNLAAGHRRYYQRRLFTRRGRPRFVTDILLSFVFQLLFRGGARVCIQTQA